MKVSGFVRICKLFDNMQPYKQRGGYPMQHLIAHGTGYDVLTKVCSMSVCTAQRLVASLV